MFFKHAPSRRNINKQTTTCCLRNLTKIKTKLKLNIVKNVAFIKIGKTHFLKTICPLKSARQEKQLPKFGKVSKTWGYSLLCTTSMLQVIRLYFCFTTNMYYISVI